MDCAEAKLRIESYVAGNLPAAQKGALEAHLASCAECRLDGELTRASKNPPSGTGSDPDVQGKPAESATPPPGDWTIESIFGSGTNPGSGSLFTSAAAPAGTPPPAPAAPPRAVKPPDQDMFERGANPMAAPRPEVVQAPPRGGAEVSAEASEEPAAEGSPGWAFEPADVKEDAKPPEGSLFFAEEALSRTDNGAKAKSSLLRVVLWGVGGLVGVALLGVSVWVAFSLEPPQAAPPGEQQRAGAPEEVPAPQAGEAGTEAVAPHTGATDATGAAESAEPPPESHASTRSYVPEAPAREVVEAPKPAAPRRSPEPRVTAPTSIAGEPTRAIPKTALAPATPKARTPASSTTPAPSAAPTRPPAERTRPSDEAPAQTLDTESESDQPTWGPAIRQEPSVPASTPVPRAPSPAAAPPRETAPEPPEETSTPAPPAQRPRSTTPPPRATPAETAAESAGPGDAVQRPIDRLHLATLAAEQNADLDALRKMRDTWRGFLRTSVGPDRARAKREMADCLWAIQTLTTRTSDQKAALAAYRDYVLNAPAGGADARTVSRMRQLEDALAESR